MNKESTVKKLTLKIEQDQDAENPTSMDEGFKFYTNGPRVISSMNTEEGMDAYTDGHPTLDVVCERIEKSLGEGWKALPVYAYSHSGVALSLGRDSYPFNCPWDSGIGGIMAFTMNDRMPDATPEEIGKGYIETLNQYLSGDVHGYIIEDEDGETLDSCWGMFGYDYCKKEGEEALKGAQKRLIKEARKEKKEAKWAANLG